MTKIDEEYLRTIWNIIINTDYKNSFEFIGLITQIGELGLFKNTSIKPYVPYELIESNDYSIIKALLNVIICNDFIISCFSKTHFETDMDISFPHETFFERLLYRLGKYLGHNLLAYALYYHRSDYNISNDY